MSAVVSGMSHRCDIFSSEVKAFGFSGLRVDVEMNRVVGYSVRQRVFRAMPGNLTHPVHNTVMNDAGVPRHMVGNRES